MAFVAEFGFDAVCKQRRNAPELGMPKRITGSCFGEKLTFLIAYTLRDDGTTVTMAFHVLLHFGEEVLWLERNFREQNDMWRIAFFLGGEAARRGNPARVTPHDLHDKNFCGGFCHGCDVQTRFTDGYGYVFCDGTKSRAVVRQGQVIVNGLWDPDAGDRAIEFLADLGDFICGILRVAASIVEKEGNVVCLKNFNQSLILCLTLFISRKFEAA